MDFKGLEYFVAVIENNGFRQAAEKLFVAQPAVSRKIAQLQEDLGVSLFERAGRKNELSEAGEIVYRWARQILADRRNMERDLEGLCRKSAPLRLVYFSSGAVTYVSHAVRKLQKSFPEIEVYAQSIQSMPTIDDSFASGLQLLREGKVDVLFSFLPNVQGEEMDWVDYQSIEKGGICAIVGEGHPLFERESLTGADLRGYPLVFPNPRYTPVVAQAMRQVLQNPPVVYDSLDYADFCVQIIANGYAGVMPYSSRTIVTSDMHSLTVSDVTEGFDLVALWKKGAMHPNLKHFLSVL